MSKQDPEIETGVETNNERIRTTNWEVEAYADDGEHAMSWMVRRPDDTTIEVQAVACEAGLRDSYDSVVVYDVDTDTGTAEFAKGLSEANPKKAVKIARDHWDNPAEASGE